MSFGEKIRVTCFLAVLPISLAFVIALPVHCLMITKSIPDHSFIIVTGCLALFGIPAILNWQWLVNSGQPIVLVFCSFILGATLITYNSVAFYDGIVQNSLFAHAVSYDRIINIDGVSRVGHRGGDDYFAIVNPNKIPNFEQRMYIQKDLYYIARDAIASDELKMPGSAPRCLIRVMVDKAGSAERIRWHYLLGPSEVVSCGEPVT